MPLLPMPPTVTEVVNIATVTPFLRRVFKNLEISQAPTKQLMRFSRIPQWTAECAHCHISDLALTSHVAS